MGGDAPNLAQGGAAGAEVPPPVLIDGCVDLDGDGVSDCTETKATNAEFATDVVGWTADAASQDSFSTTVTWDALNAWGSEPSGSAKVSVSGTIDFNGSAVRAASQCLLVSPQQLVIVYASSFVDSGQDPGGSVELDVSFFDSEDCAGLATSSFSTPPPEDPSTGKWSEVHAGSVSGETTKSALVKLGVVKPFRAPAFQAHFDNVLVKVQSP